MQKIYFKRMQLDQQIVDTFFARHPEMNKFLNKNDPFFFRVSTILYPGLLHEIICQDEVNNIVVEKTKALNDLLHGNIKAKKVLKLDLDALFGNKANLIRKISQDIEDDVLKLDILRLTSTEDIVRHLCAYEGLKPNTAKHFALFACGKQDVLCFEDFDFMIGLRMFLNKEVLNQEDIDKIKNEYANDGSIFSLCMWKIRFSKGK